MLYYQSPLKAIIVAGTILAAYPADGTSSFINSILFRPAASGACSYGEGFGVGVVIDDTATDPWTLHLTGDPSCNGTQVTIIPTINKSGHKEFTSSEFFAEPACIDKGSLQLKNENATVVSCVQWGSWAGDVPCDNSKIALSENKLYRLVNPAEGSLLFKGQNDADYEWIETGPTSSCMDLSGANPGQSFVGTNEAKTFINEIIVGATCSNGVAQTGVEVAVYSILGVYTLVVGDTTNGSFDTFAVSSASGAVGGAWSFVFVDAAAVGTLAKGYAVLFDVNTGALLSMVMWGTTTSVAIDTSKWFGQSGPSVPSNLAPFYYPFVASPTDLSGGSLRLINKMEVMSEGGWAAGATPNDCTPGALNTGQTLARDWATEQPSMTTGDGSTTTGDDSTTTGDGSTTTGDDSMTTGDGSTTTGDGSTTTGDGSTTTGDGSTTTGDGSTTTGDGSTTTGDGSTTGDDESSTTTGDGFTTEDATTTTDAPGSAKETSLLSKTCLAVVIGAAYFAL